ncbi:MAG: hypothetical protein ACKOKE_07675 [Actinomycetota bacterium]
MRNRRAAAAASSLLASICEIARSRSRSNVDPAGTTSTAGASSTSGSSHPRTSSIPVTWRTDTAVSRRAPVDGVRSAPDTWMSGTTSRAGPGPSA